MTSSLEKFIQIRKKLQDRATQAGDPVFAHAIADCILNVEGGNLECPLGQLAVEEYLENKTFLAPPSNQPAPAPLSNIPVTRKQFIDLTHQLIMRDPIVTHDERACAALHECEAYRTSNPLCPLFSVLRHV